jgi:hypothetical protein
MTSTSGFEMLPHPAYSRTATSPATKISNLKEASPMTSENNEPLNYTSGTLPQLAFKYKAIPLSQCVG